MSRKERINVTLGEELADLLREQAEEEGISVSSLVRILIIGYLSQKGKDLPKKKK